MLPVTRLSDLETFSAMSIEAEYYAGLSIKEWNSKFSTNEELNRMSSFRDSANVDGYSTIAKMVEYVNSSDLYITVNSGCYNNEQITYVKDIIKKLSNIGVKGIILGDPFLVKFVKDCNLKAIASTMLGVYNSDIAQFLVDEGFDRLIFPRDLTVEEMAEIVVRVPNVEYECFIMRNGCRYSDSNCLARHSDSFGALCKYLDRSKITLKGKSEKNFYCHSEMLFNHHLFTYAFHQFACGLCAIWDFMHMGIHSCKVVGRADGVKSIVRDVELLIQNFLISEKCNSRKEYLENMLLPPNYDYVCYKGYNCYYPEIRYDLKALRCTD